MVDLSKFAYNNKLLSGVISLRVTLSVSWTQKKNIYIYIYLRMSLCNSIKVVGQVDWNEP